MDIIGHLGRTVKSEPRLSATTLPLKSKTERQDSEDNRRLSALSSDQNGTSVLDQEQSPVDDSSLCSTSPLCAAPVCRQFWKAGEYNDELPPNLTYKNGSSYLQIHPKFLHSNATSHKWAFGAIAELLDNAVDEIQNGATFVIIDKATNPKNGSSAFLIQDDGAGMDPDAMRRCLSFGFSDKKTNLTIGQYGNGFKTSTMRLGGDVIVFTRKNVDRRLTQSIGLLSYTFLTQTGHERIVVPMVDYKLNTLTHSFDLLHKENYTMNMSILLRWSPYSTEEDLLKQFDDVGCHGTKVIIYNLWYTDDGDMELDFESDPEDIRIAGEVKNLFKDTSKCASTGKHIANRLRYSLRAYLSVLYLRLPETFCILLRGRVVEYHNIATDLKYPEFILYKPQSSGSVQGQVVTTIGFLKEAPDVNIHGFNIYHKNRLILPYWPVASYIGSRGRGVVGVLEANFIKPTHSKQDFEKTSVFQKLESRLKEMTWEYWDYHCGLIGYSFKPTRAPQKSKEPLNFIHQHGTTQHIDLGRSSDAIGTTMSAQAGGVLNIPPTHYSDTLSGRLVEVTPCFPRTPKEGVYLKRKGNDLPIEPEVKRHSSSMSSIVDLDPDMEKQSALNTMDLDEQAVNVIQENKKLRRKCLDNEKREKELEAMVIRKALIFYLAYLDGRKREFNAVVHLKTELMVAQGVYADLLTELRLLQKAKKETEVL